MTTNVRRAGAYAAIGTLTLIAPLIGWATAIPFVVIALLALFVISEGPLFEIFARPGDREDGTLAGLAGFTFGITALAILSTSSFFGLPIAVFVGTVFLLVYGNLVEQIVRQRSSDELWHTVGFTIGGVFFGVGAQLIVVQLGVDWIVSLPKATFLAASGVLLAGLLRAVLFDGDDPVVLLTVALLLWLFADLGVTIPFTTVLLAISVTVVLGYLSFALGTASIPGMLTGILLGFLTIIFGGFTWFAVLLGFFGVGGLSTKYKYGEKERRGVAEANYGARGSGNVLGNSAIALLSVIGYAAAPEVIPVSTDIFLFAFAGSIATALGDTLSSEIGCIFDGPRLITTFESVDPGTHGGVTWQGSVSGLIGAMLIAGFAFALFPEVTTVGATIIIIAGFVGMIADSVLGATIEGQYVGNQGVNFLATLVGAFLCVALAVLSGVSPLV